MPTVLSLYLSIGSGHQAAAEAITAALHRRGVDTICRDPIAERSHALIRLMNFGNSLNGRVMPRLYDRWWTNGRASPLTNWLTSHGWIAPHIRSTIDAIRPDRIVCTHALPARVAASYPRGAQVIGVITDFGAHAYWPHPAIDRYCVPCDDAAADLIRCGVEAQRIHVTGLPIKFDFIPRPVAEHTTPPRLKILIVIGGRRAGPYHHAARMIVDALPTLDRLDRPIGITIVTGANRSAYRQIQALRLQPPIELLGLVDDLPARLSCADIVIGKPGGVLTAETLAGGAAFIALAPGPGQETANANFLRRHQLALMCDRSDELLAAITRLASDADLRSTLQHAAQQFARPNAADEVAQAILSGE
jgi:processive 1,2-diacylglycerol beta-glucosyltransferase